MRKARGRGETHRPGAETYAGAGFEMGYDLRGGLRDPFFDQPFGRTGREAQTNFEFGHSKTLPFADEQSPCACAASPVNSPKRIAGLEFPEACDFVAIVR